MHLHLWDESLADQPEAYVTTMVECDLRPNEIYVGDHIQWIGEIVINGKTYHVELRQHV
jgi:hypothetical protein